MGSYRELIQIKSFSDRIEYLSIHSRVGFETFGSLRYLNQELYKSTEWRQLRDKVIIRDSGLDLAHPDHPILGRIYIHHIVPVSPYDLSHFFEMDNLICTSFNIHNLIHYGYMNSIEFSSTERYPNDTSPWKLKEKE